MEVYMMCLVTESLCGGVHDVFGYRESMWRCT